MKNNDNKNKKRNKIKEILDKQECVIVTISYKKTQRNN